MTSAPPRHTDAEAREWSIEPRRSILLQAPAGSGKTTVLTQRFLRLLCTVPEPDAILAITFTRKAAAEMRGRVGRALRGEIPANDPSAAQLRELAAAALRHGAACGWDLAHNLGTLRIQTIDSLNYWLASQLPLAARAGGEFTITETPADLYRRAARRTLLAAQTERALGAGVELLFERLDNHWNLLERLLTQMLALRGHWLRYVLQHQPHELCERINASLTDIVSTCLGALVAVLPRTLQLRAQSLPGVGVLSAECANLDSWRRLAFLTLSSQGWRRALHARLLGAEFAAPAACAALRACIEELSRIPGLEALLREAAGLPRAALSDTDTAAIAALASVLARAAAELQAEFAAARRVDYTYVTGAARAALIEAGQPTALALRTGLALQHILVDEFQDTSLAQFELLKALTAGWEEGDGRTLFVVGDPMQSIYRFRDAEVGLFIAAREQGVGQLRLAALKLTRNFRSAPALLDWINTTFARVLPERDELRSGAVAFSPSTTGAGAHRAAVAGGTAERAVAPVRLRLFPDDPQAEAEALAAGVAELRRLDPDGTIAVLVSAHAHAAPIVSALERRGVESLGVDLVPLLQRPVVRDLVQLSRALHDLGDRSAWLAVLRAPWCGARLATLTTLLPRPDGQLVYEALGDRRRLGRCPPPEQARLARVRAVLEAALARRAEQAEADWLESTWLQLGAADAYPARDLADARALFSALAARCARGEWQGPGDFDALLEELFSVEHVADPRAVTVMTIHRAKGLEFDHVLVPALERRARASAASLLAWVDLPRERADSDLLLAPIPAIGAEEGELTALIHSYLDTRAAHERTRLLYVAATRARKSLHLSAAPRRRADGSLAPDPGTLLGALWPVLSQDFEVVPAEGVALLAQRPPPVALRRLVDSWSPPELPAARTAAQLPLGRPAPETPEFSWVGETQRHIGTIVHALLAAAAGNDPLAALEELDRRRQAVLGQLRLHGVPARERPEAAQLILTALSRALTDERGRWILAAEHREAASELALTGIAGGRLRSVIIDRSFVDASGTRWVIDYKTSRHEGSGLDAFLEQELERYAPQLRTYAELAAGLGPEPVRAALYFPLLGAFRELS